MALVRSERELAVPHVFTPPAVGPGRYGGDNGQSTLVTKHCSPVPFSSSAARLSSSAASHGGGPDPGEYSWHDVQRKDDRMDVSVASFASTTARFPVHVPDGPSPGAYSLPSSISASRGPLLSPPPHRPPPSGASGRASTAPSIPSVHTHGYSPSPQGRLLPHPPPIAAVDASPSPAAYHPSDRLLSSRVNLGTLVHYAREKPAEPARLTPATESLPGPGWYDTDRRLSARSRNAGGSGASGAFKASGRATERVDATPGPGSYHPMSSAARALCGAGSDAPFGVTSQRSSLIPSLRNPAPGAYDVPSGLRVRSACEWTTADPAQAFASSAARFSGSGGESDSLGPGSHLRPFDYAAEQRQRSFSTRASFGSVEPRFRPRPSDSGEAAASALSARSRSAPAKGATRPLPSSAFSSTSKRFASALREEAKEAATAAVGGAVSRRGSVGAPLPSSAFASHAARFALQGAGERAPAVGSYDPALRRDERAVISAFRSGTARWMEAAMEKVNGPGPCQYYQTADTDSALLKRSFNITLR